MATIKDVAAMAGVSFTTVSHVVNNSRPVSADVRAKVEGAIRELNYVPSAVARSLKARATATIGLVVPNSTNPYFAELARGIEDQCAANGYCVFFCNSDDDPVKQRSYLRVLQEKRIDGLIVANLRTAEMAHLQQLRASGVPLVVFGCQLPDAEGFHTMGDDTWRSARLAVDHLLDLGHRQVAFVNYAQPEFHNVNQRERGGRAALQARGIEPDAAWLAHADISAESGYLATRRLLARGVPFTALFAGNDTIAFGALRALREAGRRVPQDVAVVGYDDIPLAPYA
ncbi:MAG: LacI family DNA-binding transcriptional regulator, partial [Burkholderia sp.]|uniref:LacI family DNA-binding transcriptional regulator n=1 Tax=Burkholderia sp. TaxID=36773 RepID=UPI00258C747C